MIESNFFSRFSIVIFTYMKDFALLEFIRDGKNFFFEITSLKLDTSHLQKPHECQE